MDHLICAFSETTGLPAVWISLLHCFTILIQREHIRTHTRHFVSQKSSSQHVSFLVVCERSGCVLQDEGPERDAWCERARGKRARMYYCEPQAGAWILTIRRKRRCGTDGSAIVQHWPRDEFGVRPLRACVQHCRHGKQAGALCDAESDPDEVQPCWTIVLLSTARHVLGIDDW